MHAQPQPFEGPRQPGAGMNPPNGNFGGPPPMGPGLVPRPMNQGGNGPHGPADNNQPQLHQKLGNMNLNDGPSRPSDNMLKAYLGKSIGFRIRPYEEKGRKSVESVKLNWARAEKTQMFFPQADFDLLVQATEPKGNVMGQQDNLDTSAQRKAVDQAVAEWRDQETDRRFSWDLVCVIVKRLKNAPKAMMSRNQRERPVREIRIVLQRVLAEPLPQTGVADGKGKEGAQGGRGGPNGGPDHAGGRPGPAMPNSAMNPNTGNMAQGNMHHGGPPPMPPMNHGPPMMPPNHGPPPMHQNNGPPPMGMHNGPPPMNMNNGPPPMNMHNGPPPMNMHNGPPPMNMNNQNGLNRPPPPPPNFPPMPNGPMNGGPPFPRPPMNSMPLPGRPVPRPDEPAGIEVFDDDDEPPHMRGGPPPPGHSRRPPPIMTGHHRDHRRRSPSRSRSHSRHSRRTRHRHRNDDDAYSRSSVYSSEDDVFSPHSPRSFGSPISSTHASLASSSRHRRRGGVVEYHRGKRGSPHSAVFVRRPSTSSKSYHGHGSAYGRASHSDFDHVSDDEELGYRRRRYRDHDQERDYMRRGSPSASGSDRSRHRRHAERDLPYRDDRLRRDFDRYEDDRRRYGGLRGRRDSGHNEFLG